MKQQAALWAIRSNILVAHHMTEDKKPVFSSFDKIFYRVFWPLSLSLNAYLGNITWYLAALIAFTFVGITFFHEKD